MRVLFGGVAALFAAIGLGFVGLGVGMAVEGQVAVGLVFALPVGVLTLYGAYLFARTARRVPGTDSAADVPAGRTHSVRPGFAVAVSSLFGVLFLPIPGTVKAVMVAVVVLGTVVGMAAQSDPPQRRREPPTD